MLNRLFGATTEAAMLREGLNGSTERLREIAHRVANATNGVDDPFGNTFRQLAEANGEDVPGPEIDLETEMVALADEQIRYDAEATLLQRVYAKLRSSVQGI